MLISELTQSAPLKTDLMELQRGNTSSNSTEVSQLMDAFAAETTALPYDPTATYSLGSYCIYGGVLYRCSTAIDTAEAWTVGHWTAVLITGEYMRVRIMHKAAYDALSADEKADGMIFVDDYDPNPYTRKRDLMGRGVADSTSVLLSYPTYTIPESGLYLIIGYVRWESATGGFRKVWVNSTIDGDFEDVTAESLHGNGPISQQVICLRNLTENAVISIGVYQDSGDVVSVLFASLDVIKLK